MASTAMEQEKICQDFCSECIAFARTAVSVCVTTPVLLTKTQRTIVLRLGGEARRLKVPARLTFDDVEYKACF